MKFVSQFDSVNTILNSQEADTLFSNNSVLLKKINIISILLSFIIVCFVFILIDYPDQVEGDAIITTKQLPIISKANKDVVIKRLYIKNHQEVTPGCLIMEFYDKISYKNILLLETNLHEIKKRIISNDLMLSINHSIVSYVPEAGESKLYYKLLDNIMELNLLISQNDKSLNHQKEIIDVRKELFNVIDDLQNFIDSWKKDNIIINDANLNGVLFYYKTLASNVVIEKNEEICAIIPNNKQLTATVRIAGNGFGKIKKGQKVFIDIESFPSLEYGYVEGIVENISNASSKATHSHELEQSDQFYKVDVTIPKLTTNKGFKIPFTPQIHGHGKILTDNRNLFQRIILKNTKM